MISLWPSLHTPPHLSAGGLVLADWAGDEQGLGLIPHLQHLPFPDWRGKGSCGHYLSMHAAILEVLLNTVNSVAVTAFFLFGASNH